MGAKTRPNANFFPEDDKGAYCMLEAAATRVLYKLGNGKRDIEVGDLINEGWLNSTRYCTSEENFERYEYLHVISHMFSAYWRLLGKTTAVKQKAQHWSIERDNLGSSDHVNHDWVSRSEWWCMSGDRIGVGHDAEPYIYEMDDIEEVLYCCQTWRERFIVKAKFEGMKTADIAERLELTSSRVMQILGNVRKCYDIRKQMRSIS